MANGVNAPWTRRTGSRTMRRRAAQQSSERKVWWPLRVGRPWLLAVSLAVTSLGSAHASDNAEPEHELRRFDDHSDSGPHLVGAGAAAMALGLISAVLTLLLFLVPARAVAATRREVEQLMSARAAALQEEDRR